MTTREILDEGSRFEMSEILASVYDKEKEDDVPS